MDATHPRADNPTWPILLISRLSVKNGLINFLENFWTIFRQTNHQIASQHAFEVRSSTLDTIHTI